MVPSIEAKPREAVDPARYQRQQLWTEPFMAGFAIHASPFASTSQQLANLQTTINDLSCHLEDGCPKTQFVQSINSQSNIHGDTQSFPPSLITPCNTSLASNLVRPPILSLRLQHIMKANPEMVTTWWNPIRREPTCISFCWFCLNKYSQSWSTSSQHHQASLAHDDQSTSTCIINYNQLSWAVMNNC